MESLVHFRFVHFGATPFVAGRHKIFGVRDVLRARLDGQALCVGSAVDVPIRFQLRAEQIHAVLPGNFRSFENGTRSLRVRQFFLPGSFHGLVELVETLLRVSGEIIARFRPAFRARQSPRQQVTDAYGGIGFCHGLIIFLSPFYPHQLAIRRYRPMAIHVSF